MERSNKIRKSRLALVILATFLAASGIGASPSFAVSSKCSPTPKLNTHRLSIGESGLTLRVGSFRYKKNLGRFAIAKISPNKDLGLENLRTTVATPHLVSSLLTAPRMLLMVNAGYFDLLKFETKGRLVEDGLVTSWSSSRAHQLSILSNGQLSTANLVTELSVSPHGQKVLGSSVNAQYLGAEFSLFTDKYPSIAAPPGALTVVASEKGIVESIYRPGVLIQAHNGQVVLQVPESQTAAFEGLSQGDDLRFKNVTVTSSGLPVLESFGVGPSILRSGRLIQKCNKINQETSPRAAVGWNAKGEIFLATATSGSAVSVLVNRTGGATTTQMARWLRSAGASNAVLLDGGGSVCFFVKQKNRWVRLDEPSALDARPLPNAIGIFRSNR